jgi:mRNA-degrading endonuclease RelE of RelBE toxin-antitoxin system
MPRSLLKERIFADTREELSKFIKRTKDKDVNVDVKKLKGSWAGYYRIRKGKIRIIFDVDYKNKAVFIEKIDYRGDVYKK